MPNIELVSVVVSVHIAYTQNVQKHEVYYQSWQLRQLDLCPVIQCIQCLGIFLNTFEFYAC